MTTSFKYDTKLAIWTIEEGPQDTLDYTLNCIAWLVTDTILTATWTVPTGITKASESRTTTTASVWLANPVHQNNYIIQCKIVTAGGRTKNFSFMVKTTPR